MYKEPNAVAWIVTVDDGAQEHVEEYTSYDGAMAAVRRWGKFDLFSLSCHSYDVEGNTISRVAHMGE